MKLKRILLAVDGSPASLEAARVAVDTAASTGADVRAVYVLVDHELAEPLDALRGNGLPAVERLAAAGVKFLLHVQRLGEEAGVDVTVDLLEGEAAPTILADVRVVAPDLIVMGRSGRHGPGSALLGSVTEHVLEFTEVPVLVVPARPVERL